MNDVYLIVHEDLPKFCEFALTSLPVGQLWAGFRQWIRRVSGLNENSTSPKAENVRVPENRLAFEREDVVKFYKNAEELLPAERVLFDRLERELTGKRILDLGVGGGRTTRYLSRITDDYTGIDYVLEFVEVLKTKFPNLRFACADARTLAGLDDASYDFVLFSYNGLDCVDDKGRRQVISAVRRVLRPGGLFMFSTHNRDYKYFNKLPWQRKIVFDKSYLIFTLHCLYHLPTHFKMKRFEVHDRDFAILNDGDHRFSLLLYYISIGKQKEQLEAAGFERIEAFNEAGELVDQDSESHWNHYLARKA